MPCMMVDTLVLSPTVDTKASLELEGCMTHAGGHGHGVMVFPFLLYCIAGEFVDGQTIGHLTGEFVDGQTIAHLTGEFVDGQTICLANPLGCVSVH